VSGQAQVTVKIPPGVASGNYIPLRGRGNAGRAGGPPGDILVFIEEERHPRFERHGDDLQTDLVVSYATAVLGGEAEVGTLTGRVKMEIPAGTPAGKVFRLRGKGVPRLRGGGAGDLIVRIGIHVPKRLKREDRKALEELARLDAFRPEAPGA
jgi:molecular chaperone DnaJ